MVYSALGFSVTENTMNDFYFYLLFMYFFIFVLITDTKATGYFSVTGQT